MMFSVRWERDRAPGGPWCASLSSAHSHGCRGRGTAESRVKQLPAVYQVPWGLGTVAPPFCGVRMRMARHRDVPYSLQGHGALEGLEGLQCWCQVLSQDLGGPQ